MEIRNYELFSVPPRWLLLKLETDDGLVGWGEPIVPGRIETVRAAVTELIDGYLIGTDPLRIEEHWRHLYQSSYHRGGPVLTSALSGIDQALWDIKGRHYGCPVYELLGGSVRERMMVYAWVGGDTPARMAEEAKRRVERGYRAIKVNVPTSKFRPLETPETIDAVTRHLEAVREAVGDDVLVGVDFHGRVSGPMVELLLQRLERFQPMFVDQPTLPEHSDAVGDIARRTSIPLATGERLYTRYDFKELLVDGDVSVVQPAVAHSGGITELKKIATFAEAFDVALVPHCPLGPVAFAASLQVDFSAHNAILQEEDLDLSDPENSTGLEYLESPDVLSFEDGYVKRPTGAGLGIDVDEATVRERSETVVNWQNPVWRYEDESLAEW